MLELREANQTTGNLR